MKMVHPDSDVEVDVDPAVAERYTSQGWRVPEAGAPKGNAPLAEWQAFARDRGFSDEDVDGKSRDELRAALS